MLLKACCIVVTLARVREDFGTIKVFDVIVLLFKESIKNICLFKKNSTFNYSGLKTTINMTTISTIVGISLIIL